MDNVDAAEQAQFAGVASQWWDKNGDFKPLHDLNPARLGYIRRHAEINNRRVLDVGCGGGILSESLVQAGANVTGIDVTPEVLQVARLHSLETGINVDYQETTVEALAEAMPGEFDVVTSLEMLEHVPDPVSVVKACTALLKPGGKVFFSTLNRSLMAFVFGIVAAEYVLRLLPKGTHRYDRFIQPGELSGYCRDAGLKVNDISALHYNPLTRQATVGGRPLVNYLLFAEKMHSE